MFIWISNRSRGIWRPSLYLQLAWVLTKLACVLMAIVFVLMFLYYALTG
jgi:hypothetical protein